MATYLLFFLVAMTWFLVFYFVPNGVVYWLFVKWKHRDRIASKIQKDREPKPGQIRKEITQSMVALTWYGLIATFVFFCYQHGYSSLDTEWKGWTYLVLSTLVLIVLHDTWFYWVHRLLHWRPLYRRFHKLHHDSNAPTTWASYSLSHVEAIAQCPLWVLCFTIPVHPASALFVLFLQNTYDTFGHSGYEFFPRWMLRSKAITTLHLTPTHHDAHHRYFRGNFGHYSNIWDKLMKTELERYEAMMESAYESPSDAAPSKPSSSKLPLEKPTSSSSNSEDQASVAIH